MTEKALKRRYGSLDGIKGLSALGIACIYHLATINFPYISGLPFENVVFINWFYQNGYLLVELFLIISGFLAVDSYMEKIFNGYEFNEFVKNRIYKIFPVMWVTLLMSLFVNIVYYNTHERMFWEYGNDSLLTLALSFMGVQDVFGISQSWNYPAWSLSQFFICWFIFYWIVKISKNSFNVGFLCFMIMCLGIIIQCNCNPNTFFSIWNALGGYVAFFLGSILWFINDWFAKKNKRHFLVGIMVSFGLIELTAYKLLNVEIGILGLGYSLCIFAPLLLIIINVNALEKLLSIKPLKYFGEISFCI